MIKNSKLGVLVFRLINHPLFAGSAIMVFGSNAVNLFNYLYHLIIGRILGPESYGELASLISIIGLLGILPVSISVVIIKYVSSLKEEEVNNLIGWLRIKTFQASVILFFIIVLISPIISSFLHISKISHFILLGIAFLFSLQTNIYRSILQGLLKFKESVISTLAESSAKLILSIVLVLLGLKIFGAVVALVLSAVLGFLFTTFYLKFPSTNNIKKPANIKSMVMFTLPAIVQSIAQTSFYSSDLILVKHFFSSHDAGIYAALSTLGKIIFFGTGPIGSVMFPLVSKRQASGENFRKVYIYSFLATVILAILILVFYLLAPEIAIGILYGKSYLEASSLLFWMGLFITLFTLSSLIINYGLARSETNIVYFQLIAAFFQIMIIWFFHHSLFEVILVSVIVTGLLLISLLIYSGYGDKISIRDHSGI